MHGVLTTMLGLNKTASAMCYAQRKQGFACDYHTSHFGFACHNGCIVNGFMRILDSR
jgi:hypothetical protein